MKTIAFVVSAVLFSSCSGKNANIIDSEVKSYEANRGHHVISYDITSEKDSTPEWHIVEYKAKIGGNETSSGHLVFGVTGDGLYRGANSR
ncbi:hypothetical protein [Mucilaginibacter polytrichastri]|uniref:Uncharacterized protein n=1 Tax=Mucilaginibacter polytrichastri TaxID=1302689 RepID=A0A1Q5ZVA2_9SPHI|nr:hypothetical protein [Mucilaginibacter polytrichastri]OKS85701.1 hypothetical protein RG47T_1147 [Mucilaginibacter polytrichastri]SFS61952.1 hypothetical protein SAMN04487890_102428 [Mucilaginibacter polytrichastri]